MAVFCSSFLSVRTSQYIKDDMKFQVPFKSFPTFLISTYWLYSLMGFILVGLYMHIDHPAITLLVLHSLLVSHVFSVQGIRTQSLHTGLHSSVLLPPSAHQQSLTMLPRTGFGVVILLPQQYRVLGLQGYMSTSGFQSDVSIMILTVVLDLK